MAQITNNKFFGLTAGQIASGPNTQTGNQFLATEPVLDTTHPWVAKPHSRSQLISDTGSFSDRPGYVEPGGARAPVRQTRW